MTEQGMNYKVDPTRYDEYKDWTGVFVRAQWPGKGYGSYDIAQLDRDSLVHFLTHRLSPEGVAGLVAALMNHGREKKRIGVEYR
jgi:hypothetical protein